MSSNIGLQITIHTRQTQHKFELALLIICGERANNHVYMYNQKEREREKETETERD